MPNGTEEQIETASKLAYTTTTGDKPRSRLAANAADKESPVIEVATPRRIAKKTVKKRQPRVSSPTRNLDYHHKPPKMLMKAAQAIVADTTNTYSRIEVR